MVLTRVIVAASGLAVGAHALGDPKKEAPVKDLMPWYRSSEEIKTELGDTMASCNADASLTTSSTGGAYGSDMDVIRIKKKGGDAPGTKAVIVFGEHARELISPESAVDFVKNLCGNGNAAQKAHQALEDGVEFVIVPNANPIARKQVEDGYYCKRTNEDGVDLNRNWGSEHRNAMRNVMGDEMNPGPEGFSEPETQFLRDLVTTESPDIFLSVHSGAYLLGAPFGYKYGEPANEADVAAVLKPISDEYCNGECPYGSLADMIDYKSEGCDIDWVSEHANVPYAFTWEIYVGEMYRGDYVAKARERAQGTALVQRSAQHLRAGSRSKQQSKALLKHDEGDEDPNGCIHQFLPLTESETRSVVENWSGAYMDLAMEVVNRKKMKAASASNATTTTNQQADLQQASQQLHDMDDDDAAATTTPASVSTVLADSTVETAMTVDASPLTTTAATEVYAAVDVHSSDVYSAEATDAEQEATTTTGPTDATTTTTTDDVQAMHAMFAREKA